MALARDATTGMGNATWLLMTERTITWWRTFDIMLGGVSEGSPLTGGSDLICFPSTVLRCRSGNPHRANDCPACGRRG